MTTPKAPFPINDASDFKAWKRQNPNAEALLFRTIVRWRVSSARLRGQPGKWVANPIDFWADEAQLSRDQTKRALATLELDGLIIRARGWFAGSKVRPFLQPTTLALSYMGRPGDMDRLEASLAPKAAPPVAPQTASSAAPIGAPIAAPTITSPSLPSKPSKLSKPSNAPEHGKRKEGFGEKIKEGKGKADEEFQQAAIDKEIAEKKVVAKEAKAKKLLPKLLEKFPILKGAHEKAVQHPYQMHGWKWATWSPGLLSKSYDKYTGFVDNWYAGKKGQGYKLYSHDEADFKLDLDSIPDFDEFWAAKDAAAKAKKLDVGSENG